MYEEYNVEGGSLVIMAIMGAAKILMDEDLGVSTLKLEGNGRKARLKFSATKEAKKKLEQIRIFANGCFD